MTQTVVLYGASNRATAKALIDRAPINAVVTIREGKRSLDQNAKLWALLSDVARAKPDGRHHTAEVWKCLFMSACGHAVQFEMGLDGKPFPVGFSSSKLTVREMSELIEFIQAWGAENGVQWQEGEAA